jgi:hypothetical protein
MRDWRDEGDVHQWRLIESKNALEWNGNGKRRASNLGKADSGRLFAETLAAEVKTIFANDTSLMGAQATEEAPKEINWGLKKRLTVTAPLTRALSVFSGTREPNGVVCHCGTISV